MAGEPGEEHRKATRRTGTRRKQPELTITMDIKEVPFTPARLEKFRRELARVVAMGLDGTCTGKKKAPAVTEAKGREEENNPRTQG